MVEMSSDEEDSRLSQYDSFSDATLREDDNETVQIGFRLAKKLGLDTVRSIDERPGPGEPDYFPFDRVAQTAKTSGQNSILEANHATVSRSIDAFERQQKIASVAELLIEVNRPDFAGGHDTYYRMLPIGRPEDQAGAELNARWYERNAKIFAKLMHVAEPGERVLVVFGAGHGYWLRHFAKEVPGFRSIDRIPFLK
ncbi:MAG: DUF5694 domain-containing protein [Myxococcota bacterium]